MVRPACTPGRVPGQGGSSICAQDSPNLGVGWSDKHELIYREPFLGHSYSWLTSGETMQCDLE